MLLHSDVPHYVSLPPVSTAHSTFAFLSCSPITTYRPEHVSKKLTGPGDGKIEIAIARNISSLFPVACAIGVGYSCRVERHIVRFLDYDNVFPAAHGGVAARAEEVLVDWFEHALGHDDATSG